MFNVLSSNVHYFSVILIQQIYHVRKRKEERKEIFESFFKEESNKRLVNTVVIKIYFKRRTSKEVLTEFY